MSISPENILLKNMVNILKSQMLKNFETDFEAEVWQNNPKFLYFVGFEESEPSAVVKTA